MVTWDSSSDSRHRTLTWTPVVFPVVFVRTRGGRVIHWHECPTLATAKTAHPWEYAAKQGWDTGTILNVPVLKGLAELGLRFCGRCLPWHADILEGLRVSA